MLKNSAHAWKTVTDNMSNTWNQSDLYQKQAALNLAALATATPASAPLNALVDALIVSSIWFHATCHDVIVSDRWLTSLKSRLKRHPQQFPSWVVAMLQLLLATAI